MAASVDKIFCFRRIDKLCQIYEAFCPLLFADSRNGVQWLLAPAQTFEQVLETPERYCVFMEKVEGRGRAFKQFL